MLKVVIAYAELVHGNFIAIPAGKRPYLVEYVEKPIQAKDIMDRACADLEARQMPYSAWVSVCGRKPRGFNPRDYSRNWFPDDRLPALLQDQAS